MIGERGTVSRLDYALVPKLGDLLMTWLTEWSDNATD